MKKRSHTATLETKAKLFRGLADVSRLTILEALARGPMTVSQVAARARLSQPNTSMHLDCLWCCGLVEREARGRFTFYWIGLDRTRDLLAAADNLLKIVAPRVESCGRYRERPAPPTRKPAILKAKERP